MPPEEETNDGSNVINGHAVWPLHESTSGKDRVSGQVTSTSLLRKEENGTPSSRLAPKSSSPQTSLSLPSSSSLSSSWRHCHSFRSENDPRNPSKIKLKKLILILKIIIWTSTTTTALAVKLSPKDLFGGSHQTQLSSDHRNFSLQNEFHPSYHQENEKKLYSDQFVAEIIGGPERARNLSEHFGYIFLGHLFDDYYYLKHRKVAKRSVDAAILESDTDEAFTRNPFVRSFEQQQILSRQKRDYPAAPIEKRQQGAMASMNFYAGNNLRAWHEDHPPILPFPYDPNVQVQSGKRMRFNDPQWPRMWYLNRGERLDMEVLGAWEKNFTGKGIVVTILDDGLEKDHPDLVGNYDSEASFDVNGFDEDPMPRYDIIDSNRHGTRCAGEVAADVNNSICGVGIAFNAKVGGIRMLDGDVTDAVEARSLSFNPQYVDVYSASWGPDDDGRTVDGPGKMTVKAFENGIRNGRQGKGSIFVWASGNGGRDKDNCNCDGYTNSIWTLSISSATEKGSIPWYSEACSATLASTYSSGSFGERQIITTDLHHGCTSSHTGTSASAPLAAGVCALALEANRNLTWRDMQHIVVLSSNRRNLEGTWIENGAGLNASLWFGFGLINATAMVDFARQWTTVPQQRKCIFNGKVTELSKAKNSISYRLNVSCAELRYMEHVQVVVNLTTPKRGDIEIEIRSPSGTRSTLLTRRPKDTSGLGFSNWPFMTVHFWGESPNGQWTLVINNTGRHNNTILHDWSLVMHGTKEYPFGQSFYAKRKMENDGVNLSGDQKKLANDDHFNHNQIDQPSSGVNRDTAKAYFSLINNRNNISSNFRNDQLTGKGSSERKNPETGDFPEDPDDFLQGSNSLHRDPQHRHHYMPNRLASENPEYIPSLHSNATSRLYFELPHLLVLLIFFINAIFIALSY